MIAYIKNNTYDEFLANRHKAIGASEVGIIVYGSPYSCNLEVFYQKVTGIKKSITSLRSFIGKKSENIIDSLYPYYENNDDKSIYLNQESGRVVKQIINLNATIHNSKFPHLMSTPDREIQPFGIYEGMGKGAAEYKNTQSFIIDKYAPGLPPENVMQLCTQIYTGEYNYGELFYFLDNRTCRLFPATKRDFKTMWQMVLDVTCPFWESVLAGRKIYNQMSEYTRTFNMKAAREAEQELALLEPAVQNSAGYLNFINERYKERASGAGVRQGTEAELQLAQKHKELAKKIDAIDVKKRQIEIEIKLAMKEINCLDFGKAGKITYYPNTNGSRIFKNNIK